MQTVQLPDPTTADGHRRLDLAVRSDLVADGGWVLPRPHAGTPLLGGEVADAPSVGTVATAGGTARDRTATIALVPVDGLVGVALRWGHHAFTPGELARVGALLRTADALLCPTPATSVPAPDAHDLTATALGPVAVRPLGARDALHLLELDLRLTDRSRRLRFNGARGLPSGTELRASTTTGPGRRAVGAWGCEGFLGEARYVAFGDAPGTAELAIAVADGAQRRGIGTLLLRRLLATAREDGIRRLVASSVPGNDGIRRLLAAVSPVTVTRIAPGAVEHQLDLAVTSGR